MIETGYFNIFYFSHNTFKQACPDFDPLKELWRNKTSTVDIVSVYLKVYASIKTL